MSLLNPSPWKAELNVIEHLTKDFVKAQEIIRNREKVKNEPIRSDSF